jgi:uncharacterized phage protein (TIGR02216 family)
MSGPFPWDEFMRLGLGVLRLCPRDFWAATPREIAAAFPRQGRRPPGREDFNSLMQMFPDEA